MGANSWNLIICPRPCYLASLGKRCIWDDLPSSGVAKAMKDEGLFPAEFDAVTSTWGDYLGSTRVLAASRVSYGRPPDREIAPVWLLSQICVNTSLWGKVRELLINGWYWPDLILGGSGEMANVERKRRVGGGTDKFLHHHLRAPGPPGLWWVHLGLTAVVVVIPNNHTSFFSV